MAIVNLHVAAMSDVMGSSPVFQTVAFRGCIPPAFGAVPMARQSDRASSRPLTTGAQTALLSATKF